jgi:hypothetical protein
LEYLGPKVPRYMMASVSFKAIAQTLSILELKLRAAPFSEKENIAVNMSVYRRFNL